MRRFNRIYKFFLYIILAAFVSSCGSKSLYSQKRVPLKNREIISSDINVISPKTAPQNATVAAQVQNETFYDYLFKSKKAKNSKVEDEVANNQIEQIKQEYADIASKSNQVKKVEKAPKAKQVKGEQFFVQIGAFSKKENAYKIKEQLKEHGNVVIEDFVRNSKNLTRVKIGPLSTLINAIEMQKKLNKDGYSKSMIIHNK